MRANPDTVLNSASYLNLQSCQNCSKKTALKKPGRTLSSEQTRQDESSLKKDEELPGYSPSPPITAPGEELTEGNQRPDNRIIE